MLENIDLEKAQDLTLGHVRTLPDESLSLLQALGRIISMDIFADHDLPQYAQSAVDGYAMPAEDGTMLTRYKVKERLLPGQIPEYPLIPGQTAGVVTGGSLPPGAVAVIPQEATEPDGEFIIYKEKIVRGSNIKLQGEDIRKDDLLARRGACLSPGLASVLAAYGKDKVNVFGRPRIAILCLGPDIVPYQETPQPGQTRDSNGILLAGLAIRNGGLITGIEAAGNKNPSKVEQQLEKLLQVSDIVLTTGGTASGTCDQALSMARQIKAKLLFWGLKIKPGGHSGAAIHKEKMIISLSGNPSACAVVYHLLVTPVLRAMQNLNPYPRRLSAVSASAFSKKGGPRRFLQAIAVCNQTGWEAAILPGQKSSMIRPLISDCNALIDLPAGHPPIEKNTKVSFIPLDHNVRGDGSCMRTRDSSDDNIFLRF